MLFQSLMVLLPPIEKVKIEPHRGWQIALLTPHVISRFQHTLKTCGEKGGYYRTQKHLWTRL